jgi:acyl-CoA thioesterase
MGTLDDALMLRSDGPGRWLAHADPEHESINAMFGGWTAAIALGSVIQSAPRGASPSAMTMNFIRAIAPGEDVAIETHQLGGSRSIEHWRADIRASSDLSLMASGLVLLTNRKPTDGHAQRSMPRAPDPETLEESHAPGRQGQQTIVRPIFGEFASGDTSSSHWVRDVSGRRLDHLQLAYLADQYAPRSFYWGPGLRPAATLTMSIYFLATEDEMARAGDDYLLIEANGTRGEQATSGQQAFLWSRQGALLATTEQLSWYL